MEKYNSNQRIRLKSDNNLCEGVRHARGGGEGEWREGIEGLLLLPPKPDLGDKRNQPGEVGDGSWQGQGERTEPGSHSLWLQVIPWNWNPEHKNGKAADKSGAEEGRVMATHAVRGHAKKFEFYFEGKGEPLKIFKVGRWHGKFAQLARNENSKREVNGRQRDQGVSCTKCLEVISVWLGGYSDQHWIRASNQGGVIRDR